MNKTIALKMVKTRPLTDFLPLYSELCSKGLAEEEILYFLKEEMEL